MNYLILVNKYFNLDGNYIPNNLIKYKSKLKYPIYLERKTLKNIKLLLKKMNKLFNTKVFIISGYRSYFLQDNLMKDFMCKYDDFLVASKGCSEHQSGLAVDLAFYKNGLYMTKYSLKEFINEINWLEENAHHYGFIIRYPKGKKHITGYSYMPWHLRYVGNDAKIIHKYNLTLEEYIKMFIKS